jgi:hypothetical protein
MKTKKNTQNKKYQNLMFLDILLTFYEITFSQLAKDPAFSTGGRPIFKFK